MTRLDSREAGYEIGDVVRQGDGYTIHRAQELSTGAPCFFHRIAVPPSLSSTGEQAAVATMRRYGLLRAPRTPRLADGWVSPENICGVEFKEAGIPLGLDNNPFKDQVRAKSDLFEDTLHLMVALNRCNIVHSALTPQCFITGRQGKIFLDDTGLDRALVRCVRSDQQSQFTLANNLSGLDIAQWASVVLLLHTGEPLIAQTLGDKWDAYELEQAVKKLRSHRLGDDLTAFFERCLNGFIGVAPLYDSAADALKAWQTGKLGSLIK
ncbi:hypothetical protein GC173_01185 [bacterium]|nr:hypothetical protein [bacterium]